MRSAGNQDSSKEGRDPYKSAYEKGNLRFTQNI